MSPSNSSCQRYGDSPGLLSLEMFPLEVIPLELLAMSFALLVATLELFAVSLELLAMSFALLSASREPLMSVAEEFAVDGFSASLEIAGTSVEDEVGSSIGDSVAEDRFVSLEGVVCSLISVFSALDEESEEQAAAKMATPAQREKRLKRGDFMP